MQENKRIRIEQSRVYYQKKIEKIERIKLDAFSMCAVKNEMYDIGSKIKVENETQTQRESLW